MDIHTPTKGISLGAILLAATQLFAAWDGDYSKATTPKQSRQSDGKTYYLITNENELAWISNNTKGKSSSYNIKLMANLDMGHQSFIPICAGEGTPIYGGTFDGNGYTIKNLYINSDSLTKINKTYGQNIGLIAAMNSNSTVKNVYFENADIHASQDYGTILADKNYPISVGVVVGWLNGGRIENVYVSGDVITSGKGQAVGSLAGYTQNSAVIKNCMSTVSIQASGDEVYVGGMTGYTNGNITISSVAYAGETIINGGNGKSAGIVGQNLNTYGVWGFGSKTLTFNNVYYDSDVISTGIGKGNAATKNAVGESELNAEKVACALNEGVWENSLSTCSINSPWSVGENALELNGISANKNGKMVYRVSFNANGGTFASGAKTQKYLAAGEKITGEEIGAPARDNNNFTGWATTAKASTPDTDLGTVSGVTTIYAVWAPLYTVKFNVAPGTFPDGSTTKTKRVAKGASITVEGIAPLPEPYCLNFDKGGCTAYNYFSGWALATTKTKKDSVSLASITLTKDTIIYAIWTEVETYTVTFNANKHGAMEQEFVHVSRGETITAPASPVADEGYEFIGWYADSMGQKLFDFSTEILGNTVIYAQWKLKNYNIAYKLDGGVNGDGNPTTYNIESNDIVLSAATKENYNFEGWYYDSAYTERATQITKGSTGHKTLYAKWSIKTYLVRYVANNERTIGTPSADIKTHGVALTLQGAGLFRKASNETYAQDGWSLTDGGEKAYDLGGTYTGDADLTLYPHWVKGLVKVTQYGAVTVYEYSDKTVAEIDGNYSGSDPTEITEDIHVDQVILKRTFTAGKMATIMLPFAIDKAKIKGGKMYNLRTVEEKEDGFRVWVAQIKTEQAGANTPYLVSPSASELTFEGDVTLNTTTKPVEELTSGNWEFIGVNEYISFEGNPNLGRIYGFAAKDANGAKVGQFVKIGSGAHVSPLRAYLVKHESAAAAKSANSSLSKHGILPEKIDVLIEEDSNFMSDTSKLDTTKGESRPNTRWFDINGRKMNTMPTTRGTYYYNVRHR